MRVQESAGKGLGFGDAAVDEGEDERAWGRRCRFRRMGLDGGYFGDVEV